LLPVAMPILIVAVIPTMIIMSIAIVPISMPLDVLRLIMMTVIIVVVFVIPASCHGHERGQKKRGRHDCDYLQMSHIKLLAEP